MSPTRVFLFLGVRLFAGAAVLTCVTTAAVSQDARPASRAEPKPIILRADRSIYRFAWKPDGRMIAGYQAGLRQESERFQECGHALGYTEGRSSPIACGGERDPSIDCFLSRRENARNRRCQLRSKQ